MSTKRKCEIEFVPEHLRDQFPKVSIVPVTEDRHDRDTEAWQFDVRLTFETEYGTYVGYVTLCVRESGLTAEQKDLSGVSV